MKSTYSTAELANLLGVNESTIKRWSDAGDLACVKTRGGTPAVCSRDSHGIHSQQQAFSLDHGY